MGSYTPTSTAQKLPNKTQQRDVVGEKAKEGGKGAWNLSTSSSRPHKLRMVVMETMLEPVQASLERLAGVALTEMTRRLAWQGKRQFCETGCI